MTCIVGYRDPRSGEVWVGGDSAATTHLEVIILDTPKVFRLGSLVIGGAGSPLAINALRYAEDFPCTPAVEDLDRYMSTEFPRAVRRVWKKAKVYPDKDGYYEFGGIVGIHDRVYAVESNLQWEVSAGSFVATGSGMFAALGALDVLTRTEGLSPVELVRDALDVAARTTPYVRPPFYILSTISGQAVRCD